MSKAVTPGLTALVVDDERLARVALRLKLDADERLSVCGEAASVAEAVARIAELRPDVVFLDIRMPDGTGFDVLSQSRFEGEVVFVTALADQALRAFEVNALDYLVKPIDTAALDRAVQRLGKRASGSQPPRRSSAHERLRADDIAVLRDGGQMKFARVSDIVCIRSANEYSEVHTNGNDAILTSSTMREWADRLPTERFMRVHRSAIVNLDQVAEVTRHGRSWSISMRDGQDDIPLSRELASTFADAAARLQPLARATEDDR